MSKRKPLVVVTRKLPDVVETRMMELFNTRLNTADEPMGRAELIEAVKTAEVLVPTVTDRIDKAVLLQAGDQLKLIANFGNGVDNIDVETALSLEVFDELHERRVIPLACCSGIRHASEPLEMLAQPQDFLTRHAG